MLQRELLHQYRTERGFSQRKLCKDICPRTTYATFEKQGYALSSDIILKLLDRLNVKPAEFNYRLTQAERPKDQAFDKLMKLVQVKDLKGLESFAVELSRKYHETADIAWLTYSLKAAESVQKLKGCFEPIAFKKEHAETIATLRNRLYQVQHWLQFEFALFANLALYLTDGEIALMVNKVEKEADLSQQAIQELYIKMIFNCTVRLLESKQFALILGNLDKVEELSNAPDALYNRLMIRYYRTLCLELDQKPQESENYTFLALLDELGMADYRKMLLGQRKRLLEKG